MRTHSASHQIRLGLNCKKSEYPYSVPLGYHPEAAYCYVTNVVSQRPSRAIQNLDFAQAGPLTEYDWDPGVVMQLTLSLIAKFDGKLQRYSGLRPQIDLKTWGAIDTPDNALQEKHFYIYTEDGGWNLPMTRVLIYPGGLKPPQLAAYISRAFDLFAPNIANHSSIVRDRT